MGSSWIPPNSERSIGIGFYATDTPGVGGVLKDRAESFQVREISLYPMPQADGPFTVLRVVSRNWEQHELSERLAQRLGLASHAISWAGTKDRRAVAERLASYKGAPPTAELGIPGVEITEAYRARDGMVLGHHFGNAFAVRLSGASPESTAERIEATREALRSYGGIPNFFGPQRFGEVRPITHLVGRELVRGDVARAVDLYLTERTGSGDARGNEARAAFAEHRDPLRALREFPTEFRFERQLLDHLARGNSPERALRALSRELRRLFVHAFQALLFNRFLTERSRLGLPLAEPVPGDFLLRVARDGTVPAKGSVPVLEDNLREARETVRKGRALVAGPLIGCETPTETGVPGEIVVRLLAEERLDRDGFRVPAAPDLASAGAWRPLMIPMPPIACVREPAPSPEAGAAAPEEPFWFRFALPKGSYATVLLREFQKVGATPRGADHPPEAAPSDLSNRAY
jgi:tRNA pseudouridine13 synthase